MLDLRTGKEMTRRETIKGGLGLAAILAAGKAPAVLLGARGVAFGVDNWEPDESQYLIFTGNQYYSVGENATGDMKIEILYLSKSGSANTNPFGLWDNTTGTTNRFMCNYVNGSFGGYFGNSLTTKYTNVYDNVWYKASVEKGLFKCNTYATTLGSSINQPLHDPYVGCYHSVQAVGGDIVSNFAIGWMKYVKVWKSGALVREWRPRFSGSKWLPFDCIKREYAVNLGSADFTVGHT